MDGEKQNNDSATPLSLHVKNAVVEIARDLNLKAFELSNKDVTFTGDNYCGDISFVQLKSMELGEDESVHLFVKKAPENSARKGAIPFQKIYEYEILAYTYIFPSFLKLEADYDIPEEDRITFGKYYKGSSKEREEFIILKDLSSDGFELHDKRKSFDFDHAALIMRNLAKFHSFSFVLKEKHPELFLKIINKISKASSDMSTVMPVFESIFKNTIQCVESPENQSKLKALLSTGFGTLRSGVDSSLTEPYNVVCHGDCWNNNIMFKYKNNKVHSMVLIDWQVVRYACPVTDLMAVMCLSMDRDLMEPHLYSLLDIYHETLRQQLIRMDCDVDKSYPVEVFRNDVKRFLPYGLTVASFGLPLSLGDPKDAKSLEDLQNSTKAAMAMSNLATKRINELLDYFINSGFI